jgi:ribonuclease HI
MTITKMLNDPKSTTAKYLLRSLKTAVHHKHIVQSINGEVRRTKKQSREIPLYLHHLFDISERLAIRLIFKKSFAPDTPRHLPHLTPKHSSTTPLPLINDTPTIFTDGSQRAHTKHLTIGVHIAENHPDNTSHMLPPAKDNNYAELTAHLRATRIILNQSQLTEKRNYLIVTDSQNTLTLIEAILRDQYVDWRSPYYSVLSAILKVYQKLNSFQVRISYQHIYSHTNKTNAHRAGKIEQQKQTLGADLFSQYTLGNEQADALCNQAPEDPTTLQTYRFEGMNNLHYVSAEGTLFEGNPKYAVQSAHRSQIQAQVTHTKTGLPKTRGLLWSHMQNSDIDARLQQQLANELSDTQRATLLSYVTNTFTTRNNIAKRNKDHPSPPQNDTKSWREILHSIFPFISKPLPHPPPDNTCKNCNLQVVDTTEHYLFHCPYRINYRRKQLKRLSDGEVYVPPSWPPNFFVLLLKGNLVEFADHERNRELLFQSLGIVHTTHLCYFITKSNA